MPKLTDRSIKKIAPPDGPWAREVPDALLPGLYLCVQPTGAKSWCVRYRHQGRSRKFTVGKFPALGVNVARKLGAAALRSVAAGNDPAAEKVEARRAEVRDSFPAVARQFIEKYAKPKNRTRQHGLNYVRFGPIADIGVCTIQPSLLCLEGHKLGVRIDIRL